MSRALCDRKSGSGQSGHFLKSYFCLYFKIVEMQQFLFSVAGKPFYAKFSSSFQFFKFQFFQKFTYNFYVN